MVCYKDTIGKKGLITRIGRVSVEIRESSFRLRFIVDDYYTSFTIEQGKTEATFNRALKVASEINADIVNGVFDYTREKYRVVQKYKPVKPEKPTITLRTIWNDYKRVNPNNTERSTQDYHWGVIDKLLTRVGDDSLLIENARYFQSECKKIYSDGTLSKLLPLIKAAINWAVKTDLLDKDYWKITINRKKPSAPVKIFTEEELEQIYITFRDTPEHSHYANFILFVMITGCRPQDAIAFTWQQIDFEKNRLIIDRAYAHRLREVKNTKDKKTRIIKLSPQLRAFLESLPKIKNKHNLVFPTKEGKYIDIDNFRNRHWKKVVKGLIEQGKISPEYRTMYCLRHSCITRLIRQGYDAKTVGMMVGNTPDIIFDYYLAFNEQAEFTELPFLTPTKE